MDGEPILDATNLDPTPGLPFMGDTVTVITTPTLKPL